VTYPRLKWQGRDEDAIEAACIPTSTLPMTYSTAVQAKLLPRSLELSDTKGDPSIALRADIDRFQREKGRLLNDSIGLQAFLRNCYEIRKDRQLVCDRPI
jgi:hypothetical protein